MAKAKAPKAPSYQKVIKSIKKSARKDRQMAQQQMKWAKEWYAEAHAVNADVVNDLEDVRTLQLTNMKEVNERYRSVYWPLEEEQIREANEFQQRAVAFDEEVAQLKAEAIAFKSEANQKYMAGKAQAHVGQGFEQEQMAAEQALRDQGINPNSAASQSLAIGARLAKGQAMAAAGTTAADAARVEGDVRYQTALDRQIQAKDMAAQGLQMQAGMVDVGRQYPGEVTQAGAAAGAAGAQAVDSTVAIGDAATRQRALAAEYRRLNAANLATWADTISKSFTNKLGLYEAQLKEQELAQKSSSGIGSALGAVAGIARGVLPLFGPVGMAASAGLGAAQSAGAFAADGGYIEQEFADGGGVGANVSDTGGASGNWSPTGGMAAASRPAARGTDTAPAMLTPGEFVVPKHVVEWKGQEYFQKLIKSAPEQKQQMIAQTGAIPAMRPMSLGAVPI